MKNVIINIDDLPSAKAIKEAADRLKKDHDLISKVRGTKNKDDDPAAFLEVARFLEMIASREGKRLNK